MCQLLDNLLILVVFAISTALIPPRVSQTAHWLSVSQIIKRLGYTKALCILSAQAIFGTVDEVSQTHIYFEWF
jgi:hypothetical protein